MQYIMTAGVLWTGTCVCVCVLAGGTTFQEDAAVTLVVKVNVQVNE